MKKTFDPADLQDDLQKLGMEGWEVISTIPIAGQAGVGAWGSSTAQVIFILKRNLIAGSAGSGGQ